MPKQNTDLPTYKEYKQLYKDERFTARKVQLLKLLPQLGDDGLATGDHQIGYPDEAQRLERFVWLCGIFKQSFGQYARTWNKSDESLCKEAFEVAAKYWGILQGSDYATYEGAKSLGLLFDALEHVMHPRYSEYSGGFMRGESFLGAQPCSKYLRGILSGYAQKIRPLAKSWCYVAMITDPELVISHALRHPDTLPITLELLVPSVSWQFPRDESLLTMEISDNRRLSRASLNPPLEEKLEGYRTPRRDSLADLAAKDNTSDVWIKVAVLAAAAQGLDLKAYMVDIPKWKEPKEK